MHRVEAGFASAFAVGAALAGAGAVREPALWWPAVCLGVVAAAYAGLGPRPFGKRPSGARSQLATAVLAPYLLVAWAVLLGLRLRDEPSYAEVRPGLFVGRRPLRARELPPGVSLIIDLTAEFAGVRPPGVDYVCLPTLDGSAPADVGPVRALVARIRRHEGVVYVHCAAGHGRSVAIVAGVLLAEGRARTLEDAMRAIRRVRPGAGLSRSQRALVRALAPG